MTRPRFISRLARRPPVPRPPAANAAFTLIELLIVVAIISILAAIAVPNFLEAQTRAKVSRAKSDMRSLIVAVEAYHVDYARYPPRENAAYRSVAAARDKRIEQMRLLTTPVAYISTLPPDVFQRIIPPPNDLIEYWSPRQTAWFYDNIFDPPNVPEAILTFNESNTGWTVFSVGPDGFQGILVNGGVTTDPAKYQDERFWPETLLSFGTGYFPYDPTNGTISTGNIYATQKGGIGGAAQELTALFFNR